MLVKYFFFSFFVLIISFFVYLYTKLPINTLKAHHKNYQKFNFEGEFEAFDFIVVGSGTAGSIVASRLSENPNYTVLLLEAGPEDNHLATHIPALFPKLFNTPLDWDYSSVPQKHSENNVIYYPRGKLLGGKIHRVILGSSSMNAMMYCRGSAYDFEDWVKLGFSEWNWKSALFYFKKSERNQRKNPSEDFKNMHGFDGLWNIEDNKRPFPISKDIVTALSEEMKIPIIDDLNGFEYQEEGVGLLQRNVINGQRHSLFRAFLNQEVLGRENLFVRTNAHVSKVLFNAEKEAIGVEVFYNNSLSRIMAKKEVILSSGAINTPQILMLSGIGASEILSKHGIPLIHENKEVGRNLKDHPVFMIVNAVNEPKATLDYMGFFPNSIRGLVEWLLTNDNELSSNIGEVSGFFKTDIAKANGERAPDMQIVSGPVVYYDHGRKQFPQYHGGYAILAVLLNEKSSGTVTIKSSDFRDKVEIDPHFLEESDDFNRLIEGIEKIEKAVGHPLLKSKTIDSVIPGKVSTFEEKVESYKKNMFALYHPTSTCSMGKVVDEKLKVYGVRRLRIVDASIMPTISRCNTNAPTAMIAEKASDIIKEEYASIQ